jgi:CBS domain-containing protein
VSPALTTVVLGETLVASRPAHARLTVLVVDDDGSLLGAIGRRQFRAALADPGIRARDIMVPVSLFSVTPGAARSHDLEQAIARDGFALVATAGGVAVVDENQAELPRRQLEGPLRYARGRPDLRTAGLD